MVSDWICLLLASSNNGQIVLSWILEEVSAYGRHHCCGDLKTDLLCKVQHSVAVKKMTKLAQSPPGKGSDSDA